MRLHNGDIPPSLALLIQKQHPGLSIGSKPRKSKYNNKKVNDPVHGKFDSEHEYADYKLLLIRQSQGLIRNLRRQVRFYFGDPESGKYVLTDSGRKLCYVADFVFEEQVGDDWRLVTQDSKGVRTPEFIIKRSLMHYFYGIEIRET